MIIGFDVGGTNARGILMDPTTHEIIGRTHTTSDGPGPMLLGKLVTMVDELVLLSETPVESIGLGVAGLAHRSGVVRYSPNLPDLVEYPIGPELEAAVGIPVKVTNDASAGAWAETNLGAGKGYSDVAYVALGTGIGTGFICGGQLIEGANGFAGETGHMVVNFDGPAHHTGQLGPWEYYASGTALGDLGRSEAAAGRFDEGVLLAGDAESISGFHVVTALAAGDVGAARIFDVFCGEVARGVANLIMIFDSEVVVLGGGLTSIGEPLRAGVESQLAQHVLGQANRPLVPVLLAQLGDEAGTVGAALMGRARRLAD